MTSVIDHPRHQDALRAEITRLQEQLAEVEEVLSAIRSGEVDAITVDTPEGPRVFALKGAETPYRTIVETMSEGALTATPDGIILYCNQRFAELLGRGLDAILGSILSDAFTGVDAVRVEAALRENAAMPVRFRANLLKLDAAPIPVNVAMAALDDGQTPAIVIVISDLSEVVAAQNAVLRLNHEMQQRLLELHSVEKLHEVMGATVESLANAVELRDQYSAGHQRKVAKLAAAIAREMGMANDERGIYLAGMVHDIGLLQVPAEILNRPARLSPIEIKLIREHPQAGYDMLKDIDFPWPIAPMILQHHERLDGSGYPNGLKGEEIRIGARILAVADVVEAMTERRPYRAALDIEAALDEIERGKAVLYDAGAVAACLRLFREKGYSFETMNESGSDSNMTTFGARR